MLKAHTSLGMRADVLELWLSFGTPEVYPVPSIDKFGRSNKPQQPLVDSSFFNPDLNHTFNKVLLSESNSRLFVSMTSIRCIFLKQSIEYFRTQNRSGPGLSE
jgi:hypothetical protein